MSKAQKGNREAKKPKQNNTIKPPGAGSAYAQAQKAAKGH